MRPWEAQHLQQRRDARPLRGANRGKTSNSCGVADLPTKDVRKRRKKRVRSCSRLILSFFWCDQFSIKLRQGQKRRHLCSVLGRRLASPRAWRDARHIRKKASPRSLSREPHYCRSLRQALLILKVLSNKRAFPTEHQWIIPCLGPLFRSTMKDFFPVDLSPSPTSRPRMKVGLVHGFPTKHT